MAWVNSLVYHRKPSGKIRVCLDPKDLNKAVLRDHHVTPTLEGILLLFKDAKYFCVPSIHVPWSISPVQGNTR